jgi:hypothetical protein
MARRFGNYFGRRKVDKQAKVPPTDLLEWSDLHAQTVILVTVSSDKRIIFGDGFNANGIRNASDESCSLLDFPNRGTLGRQYSHRTRA